MHRPLLLALLALPAVAEAKPPDWIGSQLECSEHPITATGSSLDSCGDEEWLDHEYVDVSCEVEGTPVCRYDSGDQAILCDLSAVDAGYGAHATARYVDGHAAGTRFGFVVISGRVYSSSAQVGGDDFCCTLNPGDDTVEELILQGTDHNDQLSFQDGGRILDVTFDANTGAALSDLSGEILGLDGADFVEGSDSRNPDYSEFLHGGDGDDLVDGDEGDDDLCGGEGMDEMYGGDGDDRMDGEGGCDTMSGGDGDDLMSGSADHDAMDGDAGNDHLGGGPGADTLWGGGDDDLLCGNNGFDSLRGKGGDDFLVGGNGYDGGSGGRGHDQCWLDPVRPTPLLTSPCELMEIGSPTQNTITACNNVD